LPTDSRPAEIGIPRPIRDSELQDTDAEFQRGFPR
jgi:hypothetical protein